MIWKIIKEKGNSSKKETEISSQEYSSYMQNLELKFNDDIRGEILTKL